VVSAKSLLLLPERPRAEMTSVAVPVLVKVTVSGALLVIVGVLMMFDYFTILGTYLQAMTPAALKNRL